MSAFPVKVATHTFLIVIPAIMVQTNLSDYLHHRVHKEVLHQCHSIGYVMNVLEIDEKPPIMFSTHPFNGDMIAHMHCTVEVLSPVKGDQWTIFCEPTDRRMGVSVCQMQHPPIMVTVLPSESMDCSGWMTVQLEDVRVMGRENRIRAVATRVASPISGASAQTEPIAMDSSS